MTGLGKYTCEVFYTNCRILIKGFPSKPLNCFNYLNVLAFSYNIEYFMRNQKRFIV